MLGKNHFSTRVYSLLDQGFFAAGNFVLVLLLVRHFSDGEVAAYGIGLSIALILQSLQRNTYVVQNAVIPSGIFLKRLPRVMGQHLVIWAGVLFAELVVGVLLALYYPQGYVTEIIIATLVCSLIYGQLDFERTVLTKMGKISNTAVSSALYLGLVIGLFILVPVWELNYVIVMILVALYASIKAALLVMHCGWPNFTMGVRLAKTCMRKYIKSAVLGVLGYSGHYHAPLFILGAVAAPVHAAAFVAIRGLMQPLMVIIRSLDIVDKSLLQGADSKQHIVDVMFRQLRIYTLFSVLAIMASLLLSKLLVHGIYAGRYDEFASLLTGWAMIFAMFALAFPLETAITRFGMLNKYNTWRLGAGVVGLITALILCPIIGAQGAIVACIAGWACCLALACYLISHSVRAI